MYFLLPFIGHCEDEKTIMMKNGSVLPGARVARGCDYIGHDDVILGWWNSSVS